MTEDQVQDTETQESVDTDAGGTETREDPAVEAKARSTGWRPESEWSGDKTGWMPASKWVTTDRHEARSLKQEISALRAEHSADIQRLGKMSEAALTRQREQITADFAEKKREAVRLGDEKAYDAAERGEKAAVKEFDDAVAADKKPGSFGMTDAEQAAVQTFWQANTKILNSPMLRGAADEAWGEVLAEMPDAPIKEKLAEVRQRVIDQFPTRFPNEARKGNGAARVEDGGGRGGGGDEGATLWSKVPKDVRAAATHQIETERLFDPPGAKRAEKLTPVQLKEAREAYATLFFQD